MISMRVVKKPQKEYRCANCKSVINGEHLYLFGGEEYGKPNGIRMCAVCCLDKDQNSEEVEDFAERHFGKETLMHAQFYADRRRPLP